MNLLFGKIVFFCLVNGTFIGLFYIVLRIIKTIFCMRKIGEAVLDILFCAVSTVMVFLCAYAVDMGRLRFIQVALQIIGVFSVFLVINPVVTVISNRVNIIFLAISSFVNKKINYATTKFDLKVTKNAKKSDEI